MIEHFFKIIEEKHPIHSKHLKSLTFSQKDIRDFEKLLSYYQEKMGLDIKEQAECYLMFLNKNLEETKFFLENHRYRYSTFEEVKDQVYFNESYMQKYMIGLSISSYTWSAHINTRVFFTNYLEKMQSLLDAKYLEVGPGHGEYFLKAIEAGIFDTHTGIDISPTSCRMTRDIIDFNFKDHVKANFICGDFLTFESQEKYDLIVMGEVLEHVEKPKEFLKKAGSLLKDTGGGGKTFCDNTY
ncbi:class I SAM-dependent methyltransferase [Helicobacter sp. 'house sparrow 1']|uniref:class I SAM-dependent methyltransferase n=1 Tax=Helicobacter sp. 'house sparrow 1' TaxID=2020247 RepID=UPI001F1B15B7